MERRKHAIVHLYFDFFMVVLAFLKLLGCLGLLCQMADDMTLTGPDGIARYLAVSDENYGSYAILLFIGADITFGVQSSAVLMATSMALCSTGVWSIYSGVAFVWFIRHLE